GLLTAGRDPVPEAVAGRGRRGRTICQQSLLRAAGGGAAPLRAIIYLESLPVFTRGLARLPNYPRLIRELRLLERRTHRSGKDTVEHPRNGHDDHANVVCGVLSLLAPPAFEQPNELTSPIIVS